MEILKVSGLAKSYDADNYALWPTDLAVQDGKFVAIIGPSGAGKTTFLRCLNRLIDASEGTVWLNGRSTSSISKRELRRHVAIVFQQPNLVLRLTVLENVLIGRLGHMDGIRSIFPFFSRRDKFKALGALERVGLIDYAMTSCKNLSGGQQQRVAIARALVQEARVLLADEPVASLDPENSNRIMKLLKDINTNNGVTVLVNLHQIDLAKQFADSLIAFRDGHVVYAGSTVNFNDEHYRSVFI